MPSTYFYPSFRDWLGKFHCNLTQSDWEEIIEEDKDIDYSTVGSGLQFEVEEQDVNHNAVAEQS